jgi:1-deoxy-D-xylulose-5-phosphate reductoisomerase
MEAFPCLALARKCAAKGGTACPVMNGANEVAVATFLAGKCRFTDITAAIEYALERATFVEHPTLADYEASNEESRRLAEEYLRQCK